MPRWTTLCQVLLLTLALTGAAVAAAQETVTNPADPPRVETWRMREVWRLDNDTDPDLPLMGVINQAVVGDDGHVFLLDHQLAQVLEIAPDGRYVRTLGRAGEGPGEVTDPFSLYLTADGKVGLVRSFPGGIVWLQRDGTPAGSLDGDGENPFFNFVRERGGNLVVSSQASHFDGETNRTQNHRRIGSYTADGRPGTTYLENSVELQWDPPVSDEAAAWFPSRCWDVAPDGSVLVAEQRDAYRITWHEPTGEVRRIITRDVRPRRRTDEERRKVAKTMRMWGRGGELEPKKIICDDEPAIRRLQVLRDGRIFVTSSYHQTDLPSGVWSRYDVFDAQGRLEAEVRLAADVNDARDLAQLLDDGRLVVYRNARSAMDAMYADIEGGNPDDTAAEEGIRIILLERAP